MLMEIKEAQLIRGQYQTSGGRWRPQVAAAGGGWRVISFRPPEARGCHLPPGTYFGLYRRFHHSRNLHSCRSIPIRITELGTAGVFSGIRK